MVFGGGDLSGVRGRSGRAGVRLPQTGYVWALFVIDGAQGRGHGTALLDEAIKRLRQAGHRQAFLTTGKDTRAAGFYRSKGWRHPVNDYFCSRNINLLGHCQLAELARVATPSQQTGQSGRELRTRKILRLGFEPLCAHH
jgi:ribosomal protein S18 acetylase RimI-like enzyme